MAMSIAELHVAKKFSVDQLREHPLFSTNTEAALSMLSTLGQAQLSMSVFRHAVMRQNVHHTLSTLHHKVLAVGAFWGSRPSPLEKQTFRLAVARKRRPWFEGLWANAGEAVNLHDKLKKPNGQSQFNVGNRLAADFQIFGLLAFS